MPEILRDMVRLQDEAAHRFKLRVRFLIGITPAILVPLIAASVIVTNINQDPTKMFVVVARAAVIGWYFLAVVLAYRWSFDDQP